MNAERLLALFDRVSEAPNAVARLRWFILDLAVRGKLIEQDPTEAPAARGGPMSPEERPFSIPSSWCWVRVDDVATARLGKMLDKAKNRGTPKRYLRNVNVRWFDFDLTDVFEMPFEEAELSEFALRPGDVLICEGGEPGRAAVWDDREKDIYFQKAIHRVRFNESVDSNFFVLTLKAGADSGRLADYFTGTGIKHFTGRSLDSFLFPLPPLAEQRRIVARVDELMALCDQLEAARADREHRRDRLTTAAFADLAAPERALGERRPDNFSAVGRLAHLTCRVDQVAPLRHYILDLAVRGQLSRQDSADQSVSALLQAIDAEKAQLVAAGLLKKFEKAGPRIPEKWPETPRGWETASLQSLCISVTDGDHLPPPKAETGIPFLVIGNVRSKSINFAGCRYVSATYFDALDPIRRPRTGDILYTLVGSYGIPVVVRDDSPFCVQRHIGILRPSKQVDVGYLALAMESRLVLDQATSCATGIAQKTVPLAGLRRMAIPLPPLAEQHRIVARVDELMALCDQLEASLAAADTANARLLDAILHEALNGPAHAEAA